MKKTFLIFFTFLYVLLSTGLQLQLYFCQDKLTNLSVIEKEDTCCEKERAPACEDDEKDCCDFSKVDLSIDESHQPVKKLKLDSYTKSNKDIAPLLFIFNKNMEEPITSNTFHGSPDPLYLLNCSLTFYG